MAGDFDGVGNHALVFRTETIAAGRADFELRGHELTQRLGVLVINVFYIFLTKIALHFSFSQRDKQFDCAVELLENLNPEPVGEGTFP